MQSLVNLVSTLKDQFSTQADMDLVPTNINGVYVFWGNSAIAQSPVIYQAGISFVVQGEKTGFLNGHEFKYNKDNYLITSMTTPFECETIASKETPLLGIFIDVSMSLIGELSELIHNNQGPNEQSENDVLSIRPSPLQQEMKEALTRLANALLCPERGKVLGNAIVRELVYYVLSDKNGAMLFNLLKHNTNYHRVSKSIAFAHSHYAQALTVDSLAQQASMSASSFYREFKSITGSSPLQFIKKIRLSRARSLIVYGNESIASAAYSVGYSSPSQFSREYKKYYGYSPKNKVALDYSSIEKWKND